MSEPGAIRVLLVHEPPDGGVAEHVRLLALGLREHGYEAEVAGPPESNVAAPLRDAGITVHTLPLVRSYGRPDAELRAVAALSALAKRRGARLIHAHSSKAGVHGRLAARAARVPAVYSPHCFGFIGPVSAKRRIAATAIERAFAPLSGAILCVSEAERTAALQAKVASPTRLRTVLNGIPPLAQPAPPVDPVLAALHQGGPLIGAVNVLRPQKRSDLLIDAAPRIWQRMPKVRVAIVGNGSERDALEAHARERGVWDDPRFVLLPFEGSTHRYLQALDLFVLPSDWEGLPIGLLEAMAAGVPQIVSDVGGNAEATSPDTGRVIAPGSAGAIVEAACELLADSPLRHHLETGSLHRFHERFTAARMIREIANVYGELLR